MPKVAVYTRATTGGSRRYVKATWGSTGPFFLQYEINGKRVWEGLLWPMHARRSPFSSARKPPHPNHHPAAAKWLVL